MSTPYWTNNPNDSFTGGTDTTTAGASGNTAGGLLKIALSSVELTDADGGTNWAVGDSFFVTGSASNRYEITAISTNTGASNASHFTFTPALVHNVTSHKIIEKWSGGSAGGYQGPHQSVNNHVRLRNLGHI